MDFPWVRVPHLASAHPGANGGATSADDWQRVSGHPMYLWKPSSIQRDSAEPVTGRPTGSGAGARPPGEEKIDQTT